MTQHDVVKRYRIATQLCVGLCAILFGAAFGSGGALADRLLTDMAGHSVRVPDKVTRIATVGPVPVLNSFVFAMGEANSIVNGLPPNLGGPRWRFQYIVAPGLDQKPVIQGGDGVSLEALAAAAPDVVLTMDARTVDLAQRAHVAAVFLSWRQPEDVKAVMRLLGELYAKPAAAEAYNRYFDEVLAEVGARVARIPEDRRPRVLYAGLRSMTQPHQIAEWWIARAGGRSVTDDGRTAEALHFTIEQLLAWDPEVLIVGGPDEVAEAYRDSRLSGVAAVRTRRVYAVPMGVHLWGNRTIEQPLTVLWAAKLFHPETFGDVDVPREVASFYKRFFNADLTPSQIGEILAGRIPRSDVRAFSPRGRPDAKD